jgi:GTP cyclohydrolase II
MLKWNYQETSTFISAAKWYEKKKKKELIALLVSLDSFLNTLNEVEHIQKVTGKYIHKEPKGILAVDQTKGEGKGKLEESRLYFYPNVKKKTLHLLTIGKKKKQKRDIKLCQEILKELKETNII